jgi:hypothetical protein
MARPTRLFAPLLFAAAFVSMARYVAGARYGDGFEPLKIAKTLAETGIFGNPYGALPTGPTAHCAPLYPMFLAALIKLLGYSAIFVVITNTCALVMYSLHVAMLPSVSVLFFNRPGPGIWTALLSIVLPLYFFLPEFENMYDAVGLMYFCLASTAVARSPGRWGAIGLGALIGILALLNPANLIIAALWLAYLAWRQSADRLWRWAAWVALGAVLFVSPWTIRNYVRFHQFVPVRDNLGVELYIANNDQAAASFTDNLPSFWRHHPGASVEEAREVIRMGEAAYSESRRQRAIAWIRTHPGRFFELAAARARMFWFGDYHDGRPYGLSIVPTTLASFVGLILLFTRRQTIAIFLAAAWFIYPLIYYCVQHDIRYREPILWLTLLPAGFLLSAVWDRTSASAKLKKLWQFRM